MIRAFYTGQTGAIEHQKLMDATANNMANVNTDGYKTSNLSFQELMYQRVRMPDDYETRKAHYDSNVRVNKGLSPVPYGYEADDDDIPSLVDYYAENKLRVGVGARSTESALVMRQGAYKMTDEPLDVLIKGDAFFAVLNKYTGEISYTKNGAFTVSLEDGEEFLVNMNGEYVLDENYDFIILPENNNKGDLRLISHLENSADGEENVVKIGLFTCDNIYGLMRLSENKYAPTEFSGEMDLETREGVGIIQYSLEMSNVNIAEEMVKVIQAQRAFQSNLTVIKTADEIEAYINQLRT